MGQYRWKKKYSMAWAVLLVGAALAFRDPDSLPLWTTFGMTLLGVFAVADVTDKKLNGGNYDQNSRRNNGGGTDGGDRPSA